MVDEAVLVVVAVSTLFLLARWLLARYRKGQQYAAVRGDSVRGVHDGRSLHLGAEMPRAEAWASDGLSDGGLVESGTSAGCLPERGAMVL
mmetsp:Transcript_3596/g.7576  ORF Transcript_3596/g.7576 Transcript_3596/m.7576 type:complete len:90 (-) Transcript_3596:199-468(-)